MAFDIPQEVLESLKEKALSAEAQTALDGLGLEPAEAKALEASLLLHELAAEKLDKDTFMEVFAKMTGFELPVKEVEVPAKVVDPNARPDFAGVDPALKAQLDGFLDNMEKKTADSNKERDDAVMALQTEKEARDLAAMVARAKEFDFLNMKAEDLGAVMQDVSNKAPESLVKIETALTALKAQLAEGNKLQVLYDTIGSGGDDNTGSAAAKVEKRVTAYMEANPKVTKSVAMTEIFKLDPDLYDEAQAEQAKNKRAQA